MSKAAASITDPVVVPVLPGIFAIPWRVYARGLSGMQVILVQILAEESLGRGRGWAERSVRQLAHATGAPASSVRYALRVLRDTHGLIEWRQGAPGGAPNRYRVCGWVHWRRWKGEARASAYRLLHLLVLGDDFPLEALRLAEHLRLFSLRIDPEAIVPTIDPTDGLWLRWCRTCRDMLAQSRLRLASWRDLLDFAERSEVERRRFIGANADRMLFVRWRVLRGAMSANRARGVL